MLPRHVTIVFQSKPFENHSNSGKILQEQYFGTLILVKPVPAGYMREKDRKLRKHCLLTMYQDPTHFTPCRNMWENQSTMTYLLTS